MIYRELRQIGWRVGHRMVQRPSSQEGPGRGESTTANPREMGVHASQFVNDFWSMGIMSDALTSERALRFFKVVDDASRECLKLFADTSMLSKAVAKRVDAIAAFRGYPGTKWSSGDSSSTSLPRTQKTKADGEISNSDLFLLGGLDLAS
jgi:putative transposase